MRDRILGGGDSNLEQKGKSIERKKWERDK